MSNKNERFNKLNAMGINTNKYFTVDLDNGTKIHLIIDENGNPIKVEDIVANGIIESGYVKNSKLHRRFVMAQMFHLLNYVSYDGRESGFNACLRNRYDYGYTFKMMLEEVRVLSKLEVRDVESFVERSHFFTKEVVVAVLEDYMEKLKDHVDKMPSKNCKGVPYKKIKGVNIFVADIDKKVYAPLRKQIYKVRNARNYVEVHRALQGFMRDMIKLPYKTPKSKVWIDAFKGEGSFYTLKNLIMFHDCGIEILYGMPLSYSLEAVRYINRKLVEYQGEGWRMFALMKKVIEDNNFNFNDRMREIYNK